MNKKQIVSKKRLTQETKFYKDFGSNTSWINGYYNSNTNWINGYFEEEEQVARIKKYCRLIHNWVFMNFPGEVNGKVKVINLAKRGGFRQEDVEEYYTVKGFQLPRSPNEDIIILKGVTKEKNGKTFVQKILHIDPEFPGCYNRLLVTEDRSDYDTTGMLKNGRTTAKSVDAGDISRCEFCKENYNTAGMVTLCNKCIHPLVCVFCSILYLQFKLNEEEASFYYSGPHSGEYPIRCHTGHHGPNPSIKSIYYCSEASDLFKEKRDNKIKTYSNYEEMKRREEKLNHREEKMNYREEKLNQREENMKCWEEQQKNDQEEELKYQQEKMIYREEQEKKQQEEKKRLLELRDQKRIAEEKKKEEQREKDASLGLRHGLCDVCHKNLGIIAQVVSCSCINRICLECINEYQFIDKNPLIAYNYHQSTISYKCELCNATQRCIPVHVFMKQILSVSALTDPTGAKNHYTTRSMRIQNIYNS